MFTITKMIMKNKLRLSEIVGYLPYGLECCCKGMVDNVDKISRCKVVGYWLDDNTVWINIMYTVACSYVGLEEIKPILRPMSDLSKPIIINGYNHNREFIPIEKLARVYEHPWEIVEVFDIKTSKDSTLIEYTMEDVLTYRFAYIHTIDCFFNYCCYTKTEHTITNTSLLYNLLNRWHFDYHGLIERGLAVDINTINELHKI